MENFIKIFPTFITAIIGISGISWAVFKLIIDSECKRSMKDTITDLRCEIDKKLNKDVHEAIIEAQSARFDNIENMLRDILEVLTKR